MNRQEAMAATQQAKERILRERISNMDSAIGLAARNGRSEAWIPIYSDEYHKPWFKPHSFVGNGVTLCSWAVERGFDIRFGEEVVCMLGDGEPRLIVSWGTSTKEPA